MRVLTWDHRIQESDGTDLVQAEEAVHDRDAQTAVVAGRQVEAVAARHCVVAAARVAADRRPRGASRGGPIG